ncbi:MAG: cyclic nucleotide-binding domain-containing protein [Candidatus Omnitrophica bacterium]|nr:cyclic nucleotide-binding domain-containing protein [Candidatus Omnitrophota bacterium]
MTIADFPRPQDKLAILRRIALFASCAEEQLHLIAERSRLVEYKKGETIYREGDRAEALYIIASGRLQVFTVTNGQKQLYTVLHNGDTFGEISLLTGETHSATVEALNDTLVLELQKRDFEDLINQIPSLVLHLSRVLSKRLRTKGHLASVGEATVVAIYSAAKGVGRTLFAVALAATVRRETNRRVVVVDFSTPEGETNRFLHMPHRLSPSRRGLWAEEAIQQDVHEHPLGFSFLYAGDVVPRQTGSGESLVAPIVSELANHYSYILLDLPVEIDATVLKGLTQADLIYLVSDCTRANVIRTGALLHQLREAVSHKDEQIKVILNLMEAGGERLSPAQVAHSVGRSANFILPHIASAAGELTPEELMRLLESRESPYTNTIRRIARELGGVLVGLALGSGAALGLAHIGVLKVLEREHVPIDIVAGSSIGALVAGLWAAGRGAEDLERLAMRFKDPWDIRRLFIFDMSLPILSLVIGILAGIIMAFLAGFWAGLLLGLIVCVFLGLLMGPLVGGPIQGAQLTAKLERDFAGKTFEDTWIPLKIVATDPIAREEVVFDSGSIAQAVRASVSIPGIFKPMTYRGKLCLDGGVLNPVPVGILKRSGVNRIIAINVFPTKAEIAAYQEDVQRRRAEWDAQLASRSFPVRLLARLRQEIARSFSPLIFDVIMRSMQSMEYQIAEVACREADLILRPTLAGSHWLEFYNPEKFIRKGEEEALRRLPELKHLAGMSEPPTTTALEAKLGRVDKVS